MQALSDFTFSFCRRCSPRAIPKILFHSSLCPSRNGKSSYESGSKKLLHTTTDRGLKALCRLESRGVVHLAGNDTTEYLQGLVTSDVHQLMIKSPAVQYCMMLNVQGRVLYDLFLYNITDKPESPATVLIEADTSVLDELIKILKKYKLRKKIAISPASDQYKIWSEFDTSEGIPEKVESSNDIWKFHDPRVPLFASRIVTRKNTFGTSSKHVTEADYRIHRFYWGIPEGVRDLPPGSCLPLESNLAFMNGVNFQKGCYIGQELTARTFHTGVIRKRLMPLFFTSSVDIECDTMIVTEDKGKNAGKFRNAERNHGIGLLRLQHIEDTLLVQARNGEKIPVTTQIPAWWPNLSSQ